MNLKNFWEKYGKIPSAKAVPSHACRGSGGFNRIWYSDCCAVSQQSARPWDIVILPLKQCRVTPVGAPVDLIEFGIQIVAPYRNNRHGRGISLFFR